MQLPTLYKRTTTGAVQSWTIHVEGDHYWTVSGQVDGKKVTNSPVTCEAKNIGRSNETSPEEQAQLEARAKWKKKSEEGYTESPDNVDAVVADVVKPMLAKEYGEHAKKIAFPVYSQPKLDGLRCVITPNGAWSRNWKPFLTLAHLQEALASVFTAYPGVISFDGEVYNHQFKDDFNTMVSLVKQGKPTAEDLARAREMVEYHVYDVITSESLAFDSRWKLLTEIFKNIKSPQIRLVQTSLVSTQEELDDLMGAYLEDGYEGQMIRDRRAAYENKRTDKLLKRKEFVDAEWPVVGYKEGKGNRQGCVILRCKNHNGGEFDCSVKGSVDYTRRLWERREDLVGLMATIKYQRLTPDGVPKFLTCIKFRTPAGEERAF